MQLQLQLQLRIANKQVAVSVTESREESYSLHVGLCRSEPAVSDLNQTWV